MRKGNFEPAKEKKKSVQYLQNCDWWLSQLKTLVGLEPDSTHAELSNAVKQLTEDAQTAAHYIAVYDAAEKMVGTKGTDKGMLVGLTGLIQERDDLKSALRKECDKADNRLLEIKRLTELCVKKEDEIIRLSEDTDHPDFRYLIEWVQSVLYSQRRRIEQLEIKVKGCQDTLMTDGRDLQHKVEAIETNIEQLSACAGADSLRLDRHKNAIMDLEAKFVSLDLASPPQHPNCECCAMPECPECETHMDFFDDHQGFYCQGCHHFVPTQEPIEEADE